MIPEKTNISARVDLTLKKIVEESTFNHKDAYELGAKTDGYRRCRRNHGDN